MKFSQLFFQNNAFERNNDNFELIDLMRKANLVHQDTSGIYSWLSLGMRLKQKVQAIICEEMEQAGFTQIQMSLMQDAALWQETGRIESYGAELFTLKNRKEHQFILGATCEELITNIVRNHYNNTEINLHVYQIGNKYRDELRAKAGLMRAKEFIMKDAYSFCATEQGLIQTYDKVKNAYCRIFDKLGLKYSIFSSDNGEIGGKSSEEFHCISQYGEDTHNGEKTLEIAHIFHLGQTYSEKMKLYNNRKEFVHMGCFGIGVSRLIMALLEQHRDTQGFWGNQTFNTFDIVMSVIDYKNHQEIAMSFYEALKNTQYSVLLDDREASAGKKMSDAELIGVQYRIVIGKASIANDQYELLNRKTGEKTFHSKQDLIDLFSK